MLVTDAQKQNVTRFSQQFSILQQKNENFGKIWVVKAGYS